MKNLLFALTFVLSLALPGELLAQACPANDMVSTVLTPGFSCTMQDKTFSNFSMTNVPGTALVQFGILNNELFAVTLNRDGTFFPVGTTTFDYMVTASGGQHILQGTVGVDVSFPPEVTVTSMNGQTVSIANGGTGKFLFNPGVTSVTVDNTSHILTPTTELNSITNDFSQVIIGVLEPGPLGLMGLGLVAIMILPFMRRK